MSVSAFQLRPAPDAARVLIPRIVEAIVAGYQPAELTAKALTERVELPLLWSEQERAIGMS
jgi:hypothetical protein